MEKALLDGQVVYASQIAKNYMMEKNIRLLSREKKLRCTDPGCKKPLVRYCHGEVKAAYFAHLSNADCDYARFDTENSELIKKVARVVHQEITNKGFEAEIDAKVLKHHYTHILIKLDEGRNLAVEIGTKRTTVNRIEELSSEYREQGILLDWIVIDDTSKYVEEEHTYHMKRYLFNESRTKDLLVVSPDGDELAQYKEDPNEYMYKNSQHFFGKLDTTYMENGAIGDLSIENDRLTIRGFDKRYEDWLSQKQAAFEEKVKKQEEYEKRFRERCEESKKAQDKKIPQAKIETKKKPIIIPELDETTDLLEQPKVSISYPSQTYWSRQEKVDQEEKDLEIKEKTVNIDEILPLIEQEDKVAIDSENRRWAKCIECGKIDCVDNFSTYGGLGQINKGKCTECVRKVDGYKER